ncbi:MAG TPA: hypothetical protein VLI67_08910, partial [Vicinamibacteria bacterium]|nr:hypothetical protein [Vicinamibacteria bacterium]
LAEGPEASAALAGELEQAWRRGDWSPEDLGPLADALARRAPAEAPRWLARWASPLSFDAVSRRAWILARLEDAPGAARVLVEARGRSAWTLDEEVRAFDQWRAVAPGERSSTSGSAPSGPASWQAARVFWTKKAGEVGTDLAAHLRAHPFDVLSARAALRTAAPGDPESMDLALQVLQQPAMASSADAWSDLAFLRVRAALGLPPSSARTSARATGTVDPASLARELRRRRIPSAEIQGALAGVARIAARTGGSTEAAVAALEDLNREAAARLRAELRGLETAGGPPAPYRLDAGRPVPYRPRDLDWPVVSAALAAGSARGGQR